LATAYAASQSLYMVYGCSRSRLSTAGD
jgi:hypothetical protein